MPIPDEALALGELCRPGTWPAAAAAGTSELWGVLHAQGVVNRDIKLENTLLDSSPRPLVKICDFGYSKVKGRS